MWTIPISSSKNIAHRLKSASGVVTVVNGIARSLCGIKINLDFARADKKAKRCARCLRKKT